MSNLTGRPHVPWRVSGRDVLRAIEHEDSSISEQARRAGVSDKTLRRGLRDAGYVVTPVAADRDRFPELSNSRVLHIGDLARLRDRLSGGARPPMTWSALCRMLYIPVSHADVIGVLGEQWASGTAVQRGQMFDRLPGDDGAVIGCDPDRGPVPYRRDPGRSQRQGVRHGRGAPLAISDVDVIRRYTNGESLREVADAAHASPNTIRARLRMFAVPLRRPGAGAADPAVTSSNLGDREGGIVTSSDERVEHAGERLRRPGGSR